MPKLYIIETAIEEASVYAMDLADALQTWGGRAVDILCIKEYENRTTETLH